MEARQILQLRNFEKMIVSQILNIYSNFLTSEKINSLKETSIKDNYNNTFTGPDNIQGEIVRLVFSKVFNKTKCSKLVEFSNKEKVQIPYGENIFNGLIGYYSKDLASKIGLNIDSKEEYDNKIDIVNKLKEKLGPSFEVSVFNCDALTILNSASDEDLSKECDKYAVKEYIKSLNKKEEEPVNKNIIVIPFTFINGETYLKYIDEKNNESLVRINNKSAAIKIYKDLLNKKEGNKGISNEDYFQALTKAGEIIPFYNINNETSNKLSHSEKNLLDTIYTKKDKIVPKLEDTQSIATQNIKLITEQEYEKICMKSVNNKKLTDEEIAQMQYFDSYYYGNGIPVVNAQEIATPVVDESKSAAKNIPQNATIKTEENNVSNEEVIKLKKSKKAGMATPLMIFGAVILLGVISGLMLFKFFK